MIEFKIKQSQSTLYISLGIAAFVLGVLILLLTGRGSFGFGIGILIFILGLWQRNRTIVTLSEDRFEMKVAIAAPKILLGYNEIKSIGSEGKKAWIVADYNGRPDKKIVLPSAFLSAEDLQNLVTELRARIQKADTPATGEIR